MQPRRFFGANAADAYRKARAALGEGAVVVSTRDLGASGLSPTGAPLFEVVAALPEGLEAPSSSGFANDAVAHDLVRAAAEQLASAPLSGTRPLAPSVDAGEDEPGLAPPFVNEFAGALRQQATLPPLPPRTPVSDELEVEAHPSPSLEVVMRAAAEAGNAALLSSMAERLTAIQEAVARLSAERAEAEVRSAPEAVRDLRARLLAQGTSLHVANTIIDGLAGALLGDASSQQTLRVAERKIAGLLPPTPRIEVGRGPLAVFVVGSGGSGKTSLALRVAADLAGTRHYRVQLASTDVARAGAPQHVVACAAAVGLPVRLCYSAGELGALLKEGQADVVVVDTAGHSGARRDRVAELQSHLQQAPERAVLLALPATTSTPDALRTVTAFAPFGLTGLVATRVDEAVAFGAVLSATVESGIGLAFTTHGDGIREGLATGDVHALAVAVLAGRWPTVKEGRHAAVRA